MNKVYPLILSIVLFCAYSCVHESKPSDAKEIQINVDDAGTSPADFFDGWSAVALETNDSSFFGEIEQICMNDSTILIGSNGEVLRFDRNGNFLNKFNRSGQGPGEYDGISDMRLYNGEIYILCSLYRKIFVYDYSGRLNKEYNLPDNAWYGRFEPVNDSTIYLATNGSIREGYEFACYNPALQSIISEMLPKTENYYTNRNFHPFVGREGTDIYVSRMYDYTVYNLNTDAAVPVIDYSFNTPVQLKDVLGKDAKSKYEMTSNKRIVSFLGLFAKHGNIIVQSFELFGENGISQYLYKRDINTDDGRLLCLNRQKWEDYPLLAVSHPVLIFEDNFVTYVDPAFVSATKKLRNPGALNNIDVDEESNPVLLFYHLKY